MGSDNLCDSNVLRDLAVSIDEHDVHVCLYARLRDEYKRAEIDLLGQRTIVCAV